MGWMTCCVAGSERCDIRRRKLSWLDVAIHRTRRLGRSSLLFQQSSCNKLMGWMTRSVNDLEKCGTRRVADRQVERDDCVWGPGEWRTAIEWGAAVKMRAVTVKVELKGETGNWTPEGCERGRNDPSAERKKEGLNKFLTSSNEQREQILQGSN